MKIFAALLFTCIFSIAAAPTITLPTVGVVTDGATQLSATVDTGLLETTVTFSWGIAGTPVEDFQQLIDVVTPAGIPQMRSVNIAALVGGQTFSFNVRAVNADGESSISGVDFIVPPYRPTVMLRAPMTARDGTATLRANITPNGRESTVVFRFGLDSSYGMNVTGEPTTIAAGEVMPVESVGNLTGLTRGSTYHYSVRAVNGATANDTTDTLDATFTIPANRAPIAQEDRVSVVGVAPFSIDVLANDRDPDGDGLELISVSGATAGRAEVVDGKIFYTPISGSRGADTLTYVVADDYTPAPARTSGQIIISVPALTAEGLTTVLLRDDEGIVAGLLRLAGTANGSVTGKIELSNQTHAIRGVLDANGRLYYTILREEGPLQLVVTFDPSAPQAVVVDVRGEGEHFSGSATGDEVTPRRREEVVGRYTMQIPTSGTDALLPQGVGYARVEVKPWGDVRIVGQLGDGSKFSTRSSISGDDLLISFPIYEDLKNGRLVGDLNFGSGSQPQISGEVSHFRKSDRNANFFPNGFFVTVAPTGSFFIPPEKGQRLLDDDGSTATITLTGGNLTSAISHRLEINRRDNVDILDPNGDGFTLKIDREFGLFSGEFDHPFDGSRRKIRGAFIQSSGTGEGVFFGANQTGRINFQTGISTPDPVDGGNAAPPAILNPGGIAR